LSEKADANHLVPCNQSIKYYFLKVLFSLIADIGLHNVRFVPEADVANNSLCGATGGRSEVHFEDTLVFVGHNP
jgi:hypothetical protein